MATERDDDRIRVDDDRIRVGAGDRATVGARDYGTGWGDETKASLKTTELLVWAAAVAAILIASAITDNIDARLAWTLVSVLSFGYMISRGLAKAGDQHRGSYGRR